MGRLPVCFVKTKFNYYSLCTVFASIEDYDFVNPFFIDISSIDKFSFMDGTIFCFSLNSIYYKTNREHLINLIKKLKNKGKYLFIAGGPHCTNNCDELIKDGFDIVVTGPGEKSIKDIIFDIKENKKIKKIYKSEVSNLNDYKPFPVKYFHYKPIEITRGCPHKCYFCQTSYFLGNKVIERTIDNIVKYVRISFENNIRDLRFISSNALSYGSYDYKVNKDAIEELLSSIRKIIKDKGRIFFGTFPSEIRPDFINIEIMEILRKYVDNKKVLIGAQSGSDRLLALTNRGHDVKTVENAIDISLKTGFSVDVDLILGMPEESEEDIEKTFELIKKYIKKPVKFHLHYFMPLPGTPWQNRKPTQIPDKFLKEIEYLTGKGIIWGSWKNQKIMAVEKND